MNQTLIVLFLFCTCSSLSSQILDEIIKNNTPQLAEYQSEKNKIHERLKRLPSLPKVDTKPSPGLSTRPTRIDSYIQDLTHYIDIKWEKREVIDCLVLCQQRNAITLSQEINEGEPSETIIFSLKRDGSVRKKIAIFKNNEDLLQSQYPYFIDSLSEPAYGIRIYSNKLKRTFKGYGAYMAWSEVFCFSGERNLCANAEVSVSPEDFYTTDYLKRSLSDGQSHLGIPYISRYNLEYGWKSSAYKNPRQKIKLIIDLKKPSEIDSLCFYPALDDYNNQIQGFGFPEKLEISSLDFISEESLSLADYTNQRIPHPGQNPCYINFKKHKTKKVIITVEELAQNLRHPFLYLAFSEIQLFNEGRLVDQIKSVTTNDPNKERQKGLKAKYFDLKALHDGYVAEGPLLPIKQWLTLLNQRHQLERRLAIINQEQVELIAQKERTYSITIAIFISSLILLIAIILIRGRLKLRKNEKSIREQISLQLHDHVSGNLSGISMLTSFLKAQNVDLTATSEKISKLAKSTQKDLREIIEFSHPGLRKSAAPFKDRVQELINDTITNQNHQVKIPENFDLSPDKRLLTLSFIKEAVNNATKYSNADKILIRIIENNKKITLSIEDNGQGIEVEATKSERFLFSLKKTASLLHGTFHTETTHGRGFKVSVKFKR